MLVGLPIAVVTIGLDVDRKALEVNRSKQSTPKAKYVQAQTPLWWKKYRVGVRLDSNETRLATNLRNLQYKRCHHLEYHDTVGDYHYLGILVISNDIIIIVLRLRQLTFVQWVCSSDYRNQE
jgi:hypothetical protein